MLKVDPKTTNLATLQNLDVIGKMDAGFGISDPIFLLLIRDMYYTVVLII